MQRVLVMGSSGSGKSTFARRLSGITGLPVVSIDALFWKPGWVESDREEFRERLAEVTRQPRWIMDGNYTSAAGELRRDVSDTVILFDLPRATCMWGILSRIAKSYGKVRPEMAEGCPEKFDVEFFHYVWTYRARQRPVLLKFLEGLRPDQSFVHFTHRSQAGHYLDDLAASANRASVH
jgi:adenylate kinase family enzyme